MAGKYRLRETNNGAILVQVHVGRGKPWATIERYPDMEAYQSGSAIKTGFRGTRDKAHVTE